MDTTHAPRFPLLRRFILVGLLLLGSFALSWTLLPSQAHAATQVRAISSPHSGNDSIIFIHGFNGDGRNGGNIGFDCSSNNNYGWGTMLNYISQPHDINGQRLQWHNQQFHTIKFYDGDTNCTDNLHDSQYTSHCSSYVPGNEGNNNESLYHLSCLFAWFIYNNFHHSGWNIEIVAHSMGGLIVRNAIYQVAQHKSRFMPPDFGTTISDIADFATPHNGIIAGFTSWFVCKNCTQFENMSVGSQFMNEMNNNAQNPQAPGGTDWTLMGSFCDQIVNPAEAMQFNGGRKSEFIGQHIDPTQCYDHPDYLTDTSDAYNDSIRWCDGCGFPTDPVNFADWNFWNAAPHSLHHMMYALWLSNW